MRTSRNSCTNEDIFQNKLCEIVFFSAVKDISPKGDGVGEGHSQNLDRI